MKRIVESFILSGVFVLSGLISLDVSSRSEDTKAELSIIVSNTNDAKGGGSGGDGPGGGSGGGGTGSGGGG